jgi:hypothetical protein
LRHDARGGTPEASGNSKRGNRHAGALPLYSNLSPGASRNRIDPAVFQGRIDIGEALVKSELEKLRDMAEMRIRSGTFPDWSWPQHVRLIEALDAMLHDISVTESGPRSNRYAGGPLRLVQRERRPVDANSMEMHPLRRGGSLH